MSIENFRYVALAEATSWLLLIVATIVKYAADGPDLAPVLGPIHGLLFVAYVVMALAVSRAAGWSSTTTIVVLACAVIPLGGYYVDRKILPAS